MSQDLPEAGHCGKEELGAGPPVGLGWDGGSDWRYRPRQSARGQAWRRGRSGPLEAGKKAGWSQGKHKRVKLSFPSRFVRVTLGCAPEVPSIELRVSAPIQDSPPPLQSPSDPEAPCLVPQTNTRWPKASQPPPQAPAWPVWAPRTWSLCHREGV